MIVFHGGRQVGKYRDGLGSGFGGLIRYLDFGRKGEMDFGGLEDGEEQQGAAEEFAAGESTAAESWGEGDERVVEASRAAESRRLVAALSSQDQERLEPRPIPDHLLSGEEEADASIRRTWERWEQVRVEKARLRLVALGVEGEPVSRAAWSVTRHLDTGDIHRAAQMMQVWAARNPRVEKPVYHFGVSARKDETLEREQWEAVGDRLLRRVGLHDHQAVYVLHDDTQHAHLHIVVNRVGPDQRAWKPHFDKAHLRHELNKAALEMGLELVATVRDARIARLQALGFDPEDWEPQQNVPSAPAPPELLEAFHGAKDWADLELRLAELGLILEPARRGDGVLLGNGNFTRALSKVDRNLSGHRLKQRFGESYRVYRKRLDQRGELRNPLLSGEPREALDRAIEQLMSDGHHAFTTSDVAQQLAQHPRAASIVAGLDDHLGVVRMDRGGEPFYLVESYAEAQVRLRQAVDTISGSRRHGLPREHVDAVPTSFELSPDQVAALHHATGESDLALIVGRAGSGKTTVTRTIAEAYRSAGYEVLGAAPTGKAKGNLEESLPGSQVETVDYYLKRWDEGTGRRFFEHQVLIVDEAGMVGTEKLSRLLEHVRRGDGRVILVGDPDQLSPLDAGRPFADLLHDLPHAELVTIFRQSSEWQREATYDFAMGGALSAVKRYDAEGAVVYHGPAGWGGAKDALAERYVEALVDRPEASRLALAYTRRDVGDLNRRIRRRRIEQGDLASEGARIGRHEVSVGDRLVFRRNDHRGHHVGPGGVSNGSLGTVTGVATDRLEVSLDEGRTVSFDPREYESWDLGYAVTIHRSQGSTVDEAFVFDTPGMTPDLGYVAWTRHRHHLEVHAVSEEATAESLVAGRREPPAHRFATLSSEEAVRVRESLQQQMRTRRALDAAPGTEELEEMNPIELARQEVEALGQTLRRRPDLEAIDPYTFSRAELREHLDRRIAPHLPKESVDDIERLIIQLPEVRPLPADLRSDAKPHYLLAEEALSDWQLSDSARSLAGRREHALGPEQLASALERAPFALSEDQVGALRHSLTESDLALWQGRTGVGKSTLIDLVRESYEADGYTVYGAAPTGKMAEQLAEQLSIEPGAEQVRTAFAWSHALESGKASFGERSLLVIDEAGRLSTHELSRLLKYADDQGVKVLALGDRNQLPPINSGQPFSALLEHYDHAELSQVSRQPSSAADPHQRVARPQVGRPKEILSSDELIRVRRHLDKAGLLHGHPSRRPVAALIDAVETLEQHDRFSSQHTRYMELRRELPLKGNLHDLRRAVRDQGGATERALEEGLGKIFAKPDGLAERYAADPAGFVETLRESPEQLEKLAGYQLGPMSSRDRAEALRHAPELARTLETLGRRSHDLRMALNTAEIYRKRQVALIERLDAMPPRLELVERIQAEAQGHRISDLAAHLSPQRLQLVDRLKADSLPSVQQLERDVTAFRRDHAALRALRGVGRGTGKVLSTQQRLVRSARTLQAYASSPMRQLVRRALPGQAQLALSAIALAGTYARLLKPREEQAQSQKLRAKM